MAFPSYEWSLLLRRPDLTYAGFIAYNTLDLIPRYNAVAGYSVRIPWSAPLASTLMFEPGYGLVFTIHDQIIMSGPVTSTIEVLEENGDHYLQVGGADDLQYVADMWASPEPATTVPPYDDDTHDVATGPAETVIKHYVDVNAGPGAIAARQKTGLAIGPDLATGATITGRARFDNLLEFIQGLADQGGLGFRAMQTAQGQITFDTYEPEDKTAKIRFAKDLANLSAYEVEIRRPTATHVLAAGGGEGTARTFVEVDTVSDYGRIESFVDQRQTSDTTELTNAANAELTKGATRVAASATAIRTGAVEWEPIAQNPTSARFNLGDQVSVIVNGQPIPEVIRELHITHEAGKSTQIVPTIGSSDPPDPDDRRYRELIDLIAALRAQVAKLERGV